ncbi:HPt (histidine-containing phosphotransfer) domain-containing protein [Arsukibacterium tuosuense]|uniref:HPt (Histidine-containing phosphotransfer) domain-containing protein n=1 Tax=Arsukibacterium tuosuense TaxID=1323745 RepID=A0A285ITS7_9GAMM|nr:Hpt domain-containing protein [Arsukibacterium tuosuense]SNY51419.1 HPt (histidine-containing phosphotransfer) domain-containing protein [Arsukibacterium tuosuense]
MTNLAGQAVLDLTVLTEMYGDDSAHTICQVLTGFRDEAQNYMAQLQQAAAASQFSEVARLSHSLKSMCGLVGAAQLMAWCQTAEQAARQSDQTVLTDCLLLLNDVWPALLAKLNSDLQQHNNLQLQNDTHD